MATKISNVIGAPFPDYVLRQLANRAYRSSTGTTALGNRTDQEILYLANKTSWVRLISSVDIVLPVTSNTNNVVDINTFVNRLGIEGSGTYTSTATSTYASSDSLAKNWILQAGTSLLNNNGTGDSTLTLRQGIGPNGAYGLGGTQELGYRPMPGLNSVTIETTGRLGSLRQATVNFKVWNMNQLNTIEALYFRLGYSMLLEWGHTQYFANQDTKSVIVPGGVFVPKDTYGIGDPFNSNLRKEDIQREIAIKREKTSGNYDGMLGIVTNFTWSFNQDGGYDCTLKLVGLGSIMDSLRINQLYKLPAGTIKQYKGAEGALDAFVAQQIALLRKEVDTLRKEKASAAGGGSVALDPVPTTKTELTKIETDYDNFRGTDIDPVYGVLSIRDFKKPATPLLVDYIGVIETAATLTQQEAQSRFSGLYLNRGGKLFQIATKDPKKQPPKVTINTGAIQSFNTIAKTKDYGSITDPVIPPVVRYTSRLSTQGTGLITLIDIASEYDVVQGDFGIRIPEFISTADKLKAPATGITRTITERTFTTDNIVLPAPYGTVTRFLTIDYSNPVAPSTDFQPTRQELIDAIDRWQAGTREATITSVSFVKSSRSVVIKGFFQIRIYSTYKGPKKDVNGRDITPAYLKSLSSITVIDDPTDPSKTRVALPLDVTISFSTNNPGFFDTATPATTPPPPAAAKGGAGSSGDTGGAVQKTASDQTDSSMGFSSALHAMLTVVQTVSQAESLKAGKKAPNQGRIVAVDLTATTEAFYRDGIFKDVISPEKTLDLQNPTFDLTAFAQKGFATELMTNYAKFANIPYVGGSTDPVTNKLNFTSLLKSIVLKYKQNNVDGTTYPGQFPVYISLGYLLAFLNNMCLFYDSKTDTAGQNQTGGNDNRPYVYIDFNPETNFCLTAPQQFSVDPLICMIPANLDQNEYLDLFPQNIKPENAFNPTGSNAVSEFIDNQGFGFKSGGNPYRGKTMNILISTQYLLRTLRDFTTSDPQHAVNLHPFLERVMMDINKCLGTMNLFRVAYRDDTNTIQIQDDQYVPALTTEPTAVERETFINNLKNNSIQSGELPIFSTVAPGPDGQGVKIPALGIAREMQFKTVMSTKMASMLAISAQAATGSVNAKDHSELSYLNQTYRDRYKPYIKDQTNGQTGNNVNTVPVTGTKASTAQNTKSISNDQDAANRFNEHVKSIYTSLDFVADKVDSSKNYYIERISKVKSGDIITSAAPFIPAELELTLDGVSGITMGNAFTIPKERLPLSLKNVISPGQPDGLPKVGFIVNGLTHTIESNQWLTRVKGQMIKLREQSTLGRTVPNLLPNQTGVTALSSQVASSGGRITSTNRDRNDPESPCYLPPFELQPGRIDTLPGAGKKREGILAWRKAFPGGKTAGLKAFLEAQTIHEGFYPADGGKSASKSWRTNNPGNIGNTDDGTTNQIANLTAGVQLQIDLLGRIIAGDNRNYPKDPTLYEYISRYAPPCYRPDKANNPNLYTKSTNNPISYTNAVIAYVKGEYGIDIAADMRLSEIIAKG